MSLRRCEKLMAARIVKTVPSAACLCGSVLTVVPTISIIHSELFGNQFVRAPARGVVVEDIDNKNFLSFVIPRYSFYGFANASRCTRDDPSTDRHLVRQKLFLFQKLLRPLDGRNLDRLPSEQKGHHH